MTAILNTLLEVTVYSAVLYVAILLFQKAFQKHISAALNYAVWVLLVLRLMIPVTVDSGLHFFTIPDRPVQAAQTPAVSNSNDTVQSVYLPEQQTIEKTSSETPINNEINNTSVNNQNKIKSWDISWQTVLVIIWGAGVLGSACYLAVHWLFLWKRIKRCGTEVPEYVLKLAEKCKSDMGVRADIEISVQRWLKSPALSASLKPKLLLPAHMLHTMDDRQLEFAIRHELAHCRRRDHLMNILIIILRCVYWFNPVIHLAFRSIQTDMEAACDASVTYLLNGSERTCYIRTMIDLSGKGSIQHVLGMSMSKGRKAMEKRIRGLFMRKKTKMSVRMACCLLAGLMLIVCFTTACQPTPETPAVIGRQENILANVTPVPSDDFVQIETPDHISEVHDDFPYLKITYDTDVVVPETTAYPVTEVTKRIFTDDDILSFIKLFAGKNDELYSSWTLTKDDYLSLLTKVKQYEGSQRVTQDDVTRLQEIYNKAESNVENPLINSISDLPADMPASVYVETGNNAVAYFGFDRNGNSFYYSRNHYLNMDIKAASSVKDDMYEKNMDGPIEHFKWTQPGEPEISQQDAYNKAMEYLSVMGMDLDLYYAEPCSVITNIVDKTTGWQFTFTRTISNLQTLYDTGGSYINPDALPSYGSPWGEEVLTISVDKYGICSLFWRGASQISLTAVESARLEPFETIHQRITDQLNYVVGSWGKDREKVLEIMITEIKLGVSMISVKDEPDIGEYLPTWYVSYRYNFEGESGTEWELQQIMFSAIDGGYIEPRVTNNKIMGNISSDSSSK